MSYSTKEVWIPCDSIYTENLTANTERGKTGEAISAITSGGAAISRGLLCGVAVKASAAAANNNGDATDTTKGLEARVYTDASKTQLLYSVFLDLDTLNVPHNTPSTVHASDTLATPIPLFETPYFTIRSGASAVGTIDYTTTFLVMALA